MTTMTALVIVGVLTGTPTSPQADSEAPWGKRVTYEAKDEVDVISDIVYARYGDRILRLDLYLPHDRSRQKIPGIVVIHGGGWRQARVR